MFGLLLPPSFHVRILLLSSPSISESYYYYYYYFILIKTYYYISIKNFSVLPFSEDREMR